MFSRALDYTTVSGASQNLDHTLCDTGMTENPLA